MTSRVLSLPLALSLSLSAFLGSCLCTNHYMLTKFEMTFPGTPMDLWHGDEEKQGAHMKREAGAGMRIEKQKEKSCSSESDCARPTSYKPGELFHDPF